MIFPEPPLKARAKIVPIMAQAGTRKLAQEALARTRETLESKANRKAYRQKPKYKAYQKSYRQTPENKAKSKLYMKAYRQKKKLEKQNEM